MPQLKIDGKLLEYDVRHSSRAKKARIEVGLNTLRVVVPECSNLNPEKFLKNKLDWVLEKKLVYDKYKQKIPNRDFTEGGKIPVLGQERKIVIKNQRSHEVKEGEIVISKRHLNRSSLKEKVKDVLKREAKMVVNKKVEALVAKNGFNVCQVYIRDQKTKWGSCSSKNNLSLNWRLILAPEEVLDYVIAHELAHLENKKHDADFWNKVAEIYPDFEKGYEWLKENSHRLVYSKQDYLERN